MAAPSIVLRNPHSVLAALERRPGDVLHVKLPSGLFRSAERGDEGIPGRDAWLKVAQLARQHKVNVTEASNRAPEGRGREVRDGREGGAEATIRPLEPVALEDMIGEEIGPEDRRVWLAIDQVQDPHNLGAIFRTAGFFGVAGIITLQERAAPLSGTVYDIACGGVETVPHALETNLARALEKAKDRGLWILGTSEHDATPMKKVPLDRSWLIVVGNEEKGLRRLTLEKCDMTCAISGTGDVKSLNVSVAAGILISHFS